MKDLFKNIALFGSATLLDKFVAFLLLPLYARVFTVEEFGALEMIQSFIAVITIFAYLQLETSLQRYYYTVKENGKLFFTLYLTILTLSIMLTIISIIYSTKISFYLLSDILYQKAIIIAAVSIPFTVSISIFSIILRFENQNKKFIIVVILRLITLLILIFSLIFKLKILGLFIAQLCASIIATTINFLYIKKYMTFEFSFKLLKQMLKYAIPQFPARVGSSANAYANRFIINNVMNTYSLGIFSMVLKISSSILLIHSAFMMAWNQFMFQMINHPQHKIIFISLLSILSPVLFLLVSILTLFSYEMIYYILTPEYIESSKYIGIMSLSFTLLIVKEIIDIGPKFKEKTYYLSINFIISVIVNLLTLYIFIKYFGISGAVFSMLLTNFVLVLTSWFTSYKIYPIKYEIKELIINILPVLIVNIVIFNAELNLPVKLYLLIVLILFYSTTVTKALKKYISKNIDLN